MFFSHSYVVWWHILRNDLAPSLPAHLGSEEGGGAEGDKSEEQLPGVIEHQDGADDDGGQLHDGHLVAGRGHPAHAAGGPGELRAHGGEGIGL